MTVEIVRMAKPGIPVEKPQRRKHPDIIDPTPQRLPIPVKPIEVPREPVPVRR